MHIASFPRFVKLRSTSSRSHESMHWDSGWVYKGEEVAHLSASGPQGIQQHSRFSLSLSLSPYLSNSPFLSLSSTLYTSIISLAVSPPLTELDNGHMALAVSAIRRMLARTIGTFPRLRMALGFRLVMPTTSLTLVPSPGQTLPSGLCPGVCPENSPPWEDGLRWKPCCQKHIIPHNRQAGSDKRQGRHVSRRLLAAAETRHVRG